MIKLDITPGKYIVAVSGGVDSVVLLDMLARQPNNELIVAHFDHGIRQDSKLDRRLVAKLAEKYNLTFEYGEGHLGERASEAKAREARYTFLRQVCEKYDADGIITAHHADDALETSVLNILRGTRRKGISALGSSHEILRPLLTYSKKELQDYAITHNLQWREDSTNTDQRYVRNWIRKTLVPRLTRDQQHTLHQNYLSAKSSNEQIDKAVQDFLKELTTRQGLLRKPFIQLSHVEACEVMAEWLRKNHVQDPSRKRIDSLVVAIKTLPPGKHIVIDKRLSFLITNPHVVMLG